MAENPAINDNYQSLLYKLAKNFYDYGVGLGKSGLSVPQPSWSEFYLLRNMVANTAIIAT